MELFVVCVEGVNGVTIRTVCFLLVCSVVGTFYIGKQRVPLYSIECPVISHYISFYPMTRGYTSISYHYNIWPLIYPMFRSRM